MTRNLLIVMWLIAALGVTACTGSPEQPSTGEVYSDRVVTPRQSQTATQTLYVATQQCPIFDPAQDQWDSGNGIGTPPLVPEIHAGLMRFTDDVQNPVAHDLAESHVVTPDLMHYRFTLRPDLRFSDGSQITAQDFKTSWERALQIGRERGYAHQMLGDIVGAAAVRDQSTSDLTGVTVIDERTLDIELAVPNAQFGMLMAHPVSFVVKADQTQLWDTLWPDTFNDIVAEAYEPGYPAPNRILPKLLQPMVGEVVPISPVEARDIPTALQQQRVDGTFYILDDSETERFLYPVLLSNLTERWWQRFGIDFRLVSQRIDDSSVDQPYDAQLWQMTLQYPHPQAVLGVFDSAFGTDDTTAPLTALQTMFDDVDSGDRAAEAEAYAEIEQFLLDESLGITLDWDVGWMPVAIQPYVHGFTGATFPRSMFHSVWMDDSAPERPVP